MSIFLFQVIHLPNRETCTSSTITSVGAMRRLCMTIPRTFMFLLLFSSLYIHPAIAGFAFNWSHPTQCDQLTVKWQGGSRPFHLLVVPVGNHPFLEARMSI